MTNPNAWLTKLTIDITEEDNSPCLMKIDLATPNKLLTSPKLGDG